MVKILRVLRVLRPLRAINRAKGLKVRPPAGPRRPQTHHIGINAAVSEGFLCVCPSVPAARGAVCVRGHQNDRQHHDRHHATAVHVCLHRRAAVQGQRRKWIKSGSHTNLALQCLVPLWSESVFVLFVHRESFIAAQMKQSPAQRSAS